MSRGVLGRLATVAVERPRRVLLVVLVAVVLAVVSGGGVNDRLSAGGFFDESSESRLGDKALEEHFGAGPRNAAILFDPIEGFFSGTKPQLVALHRALEADPLIANVISPVDPETGEEIDWPTGLHPLVGQGGKSALLGFTILGDENEVLDRLPHVEERYTGVVDGVEHRLTGPAAIALETREIAEEDLTRSEMLTAPFTLVALLLVFGGLIAAFLPLVIAVIAIIGTLVVLTIVTGFTDVSVFARTLTTALGLGLGIDYSLFIVSRFREERAHGHDVDVAINRTLQTAGRTVLFSAATVAVSLAALFLFPVVYLRSFAWAGIAVVGLAAVAAVVALPSVLVLLGPRLDKLSIRRKSPEPDHVGFWQRQARRVLRRPVPYAIAVTAVLVVAGLPFFGANLSRVDDRVLPESAETRSSAEQIRDQYGSSFSTIDVLVADFTADGEDFTRCQESEGGACRALDAYGRDLFEIEGVESVSTEKGTYTINVYAPETVDIKRISSVMEPLATEGATHLVITLSVEPISAEGRAVVQSIRDLPSPFEEVLVTGDAARVKDLGDVLTERLPWALVWVAVSTFVVLILMLGAPLMPIKALALNLLSLTATFGALVWVFQDGHLSGLLRFSSTGSIDMFTPILMFCIAFGLSMDYEVFLLSRIKEEYDISGDNEHSVEVGLGKTGPIVTAAAILLAMVFAAIGTSSVTVVKMLGVGMVLAVLSDVFLIRATLVPAFMKLAGGANWWAPAWLRRWHLRWGLWEGEPVQIGD